MNDNSKTGNSGLLVNCALGAVLCFAAYGVLYDMAGSTFLRQTFSTPTTCAVVDGSTIVTTETNDDGNQSGGKSRYVKVHCYFGQAKALGGTQYVEPVLSAENAPNDEVLGYWDSKTHRTIYWNDLANLPHRAPVRKGNVYPCVAGWSKPRLPFTIYDAGIGGSTIYIQDCET